MSKGADADRLPPLTDVHALFNLAIAPPLALTSRPNAGTVIPIRRQESSGSTGGDKSALGKIRGVLKRMTSDSAQLQIGSPVNFRHVVHVDHGKVEVYDRSAADPSMLPPPQPVTLSRKNGSFGMNLKTVDGRTIVTVVSEGGAAQETGLIKVGNEITAIDGESIVNLEHEEVIARLKTRASVLLLVSDTRDATVAKPPVNSSVCRVCSKPASFNCSACGTLILYCSSECQRNDWPTHSTECVSTTGAAKQAANSTGKTTAGPCHVCSETGRFQCACRSVLYCSQKCQGVDFPAHKVHCSFVTGVPSTAGAASAASQPAGGRPPLPPSGARPTKPLPYASSTGQLKASDNCFYVAADRFVFKMAFRLGAFESMWSSELLPADTPAKHASMVHSHGKLFISLGAFIFCLETERGEVRWRKELGYPFDQEVRALCAIPESATSNAPGALVVGASGHLLLLEASNGHELQRKLVSTAFAPVGLYAYKSTLVAASEGMAFGVGVEHGLSTLQLSWRTRLDNANVVEGLAASVSASRPANAPPANVAVLAGAVTLLRLGKGDVVAEGAAVETPSPALLCGNEHGLVSFENGTLTKYDTSSAQVLWTKKIDDCEGRAGTLIFNRITTAGEPSVPRQVVYVGVYHRIAAVDLETGDVLWVARLQSPKADDPSSGIVTIVKIGDCLIAATGGRIFALHATSGNPLRKAPLPRSIDPSRHVTLAISDDTLLESLPAAAAASLPL